MSKLATRAELVKLGHTLDVEPEALDFLSEVPAEQLRSLRISIYELLFRQDRELFRRLAAGARWLPTPLTLKFVERVGPLLTARVTAEVPSRDALQMALRTSTAFSADVLVHLDPRRTRDLLRQLPTEWVVELAQELARRGDWMTMSRFVDFFPDEVIAAVVEAIEDEGVFLRVIFFMGSKNRIDHLIRMLPQERLEHLLLLVEEESELLPAFLSLLVHVTYAQKRKLGDLAAAQPEPVLTGFVRGADEQGLWADMLPVVAAMSDLAQQKVVNLPVLREAPVQEGIIQAADEQDLWGVVLPLIELMDDANRDAVARIVAGRGRETLERAAGAALMGEHWEELLDLVRRMPRTKQDELAAIVGGFGEVDPDLSSRIATRAEALGLELVT